jgi:hypothetical protein
VKAVAGREVGAVGRQQPVRESVHRIPALVLVRFLSPVHSKYSWVIASML